MNHLFRSALATVVIAFAAAYGTGLREPRRLAGAQAFLEVNFNKGDAAAVVALYAPDAELVMSGSKTVKGTEAIRAAVDSMIKSGVKVSVEILQNVGAGDVAYVYGIYAVTDHDGGSVVERGNYLEVWRLKEGAWKLSLDVNAAGPANTNVAPAPTAPPPTT